MALLAVALLAGSACVAPFSWASGLPDGRVYELVSPAQKNGSVAGAENLGLPTDAFARADGNGIFFGVAGPTGEELKNAVDSEAVALRSHVGVWSTHGVLPAPQGRPNLLVGTGDRYWPSTDLRAVLFAPDSSFVPQIPANGTQAASVYIAGEDGSSLVWVGMPRIASPAPPLGEVRYGTSLNLAGASSDLGAVFFAYYGTLVPEDEDRAEILTEHGGANEFPRDPGLYEWRAGRSPALVNAGKLPDGSYSKFGAEPAATGNNLALPAAYDNQVSSDGSRAFFVSPSQEACRATGCDGAVPQLYVRRDGVGSVLVSRTKAGGEAPDGPMSSGSGSYMFASSDGSRVFFESIDALTGPAEEAVTHGLVAATSVKMYMFDTDTEEMTWLPDVGTSSSVPTAKGAVVATVVASDEVSRGEPHTRMLFARTTGGDDATEIDLWIEGPNGGSVTPVVSIPGGGSVTVARAVDGGRVFVFDAGGDVGGGAFNSGGYEQVYRYDSSVDTLECVSCPPAGVAPSGGAHLSTDDTLQGGSRKLPLDSRGVSSDGSRVFFDSPDPLVSEDVDGKRDVYEWENGRVFLISSGTGLRNSYFLDNGESGDDVFFTTADDLVGADTDGGYDVYDARVGGRPELQVAPSCVSGCQGEYGPQPVFGTPTSAAFSGPRDVTEEQTVGSVSPKPKPRKKPKPKKKPKSKAGKKPKSKAGKRSRSKLGGGVR